MLSAIDDRLSPTGSTLSAMAGNHRLFLKQSSLSIVEGRSLNEAVQLLATIHHAIKILSECRSQYGDAWLVTQGYKLGLNIDASFIANYEHLLLRLQAELIDVIARRALEELLRGRHNKKQRRLLGWFTEFAEKPHPLSTSFPWTIKPSLAVLWGVCWMFYDFTGDQDPKSGSHRVPQDKVLQQLVDFNLDVPGSSDCKFCMLSILQPQDSVSVAELGRPRLRSRTHRDTVATCSATASSTQPDCGS